MPQPLPDLSPAQQAIMEIVWDREEVSAREVLDLLNADRSDPLTRNTVRTTIERMEEKGWLRHRVDGRTFLYSAARPQAATTSQKVREIVDTLFGGKPERLVAALIDDRRLTPKRIAAIRDLLDEAEQQAAETKRGKSRRS